MIGRTLALAVSHLVVLWLGAAAADAQGFSLIGGGVFLQDGPPKMLVQASAQQPATVGVPSLFRGRETGTLFEPRAARGPAGLARAFAVPIPSFGSQADRIRHIIAAAEAGTDGYDAVQHGATRRPAKPPTRMTLSEIFGWIKATPGQPHAIGRYQFIPSTLARLVTDLGVGPQEIFSPALQDRLADLLLAEAGYVEASRGRMSRHAFMNNLSKIWAGLPNSTGRSHYHGYAGNAATMSWADFDTEMAKIFQG